MSLIYRYYTFLHCIPETSIHLHFTMDSVLSGTWRTCFSPLCNHSIIKETRENVNHSGSFVCWFSPCVTDHSVLTDMFRNTPTYDPDQFHPSSNCSSSSMLCTSFTAARSCAECGYPAVYHATCFRISRIAVSSLLYFICRPAWRRIISFTSESSGFFGTVPCSRYSAVCAKIHGCLLYTSPSPRDCS